MPDKTDNKEVINVQLTKDELTDKKTEEIILHFAELLSITESSDVTDTSSCLSYEVTPDLDMISEDLPDQCDEDACLPKIDTPPPPPGIQPSLQVIGSPIRMRPYSCSPGGAITPNRDLFISPAPRSLHHDSNRSGTSSSNRKAEMRIKIKRRVGVNEPPLSNFLPSSVRLSELAEHNPEVMDKLQELVPALPEMVMERTDVTVTSRDSSCVTSDLPGLSCDDNPIVIPTAPHEYWNAQGFTNSSGSEATATDGHREDGEVEKTKERTAWELMLEEMSVKSDQWLHWLMCSRYDLEWNRIESQVSNLKEAHPIFYKVTFHALLSCLSNCLSNKSFITKVPLYHI